MAYAKISPKMVNPRDVTGERRRRMVNPRDTAGERRRRRKIVNPSDIAGKLRRRSRMVNHGDIAGERRRRRRMVKPRDIAGERRRRRRMVSSSRPLSGTVRYVVLRLWVIFHLLSGLGAGVTTLTDLLTFLGLLKFSVRNSGAMSAS